MKNKNLIIIVLVVVVLIGGFIFYQSQQNQQKKIAQDQDLIQQEVIPTISPDELGLILTARSDKRAVTFEVTNIKGITVVDYEVSYLAKGSIPRGAIGHIEVKAGITKIVPEKWIDLGTCSSGKCKYDEGVTSVKLILKIIKEDGKTYQAEKSLDLTD